MFPSHDLKLVRIPIHLLAECVLSYVNILAFVMPMELLVMPLYLKVPFRKEFGQSLKNGDMHIQMSEVIRLLKSLEDSLAKHQITLEERTREDIRQMSLDLYKVRDFIRFLEQNSCETSSIFEKG